MFNEAELEQSIIDLLVNEVKYNHVNGDEIHKEISEILLKDDIKNFLLIKYDISETEANNIIKDLESNTRLPLYDSNKKILSLLANGYDFKRENINDKDIHISFIDYENIDNNKFKIVNQLQIKGLEETRIPDGIIYINGIPVVVFEFKSAVKENTTVKNAYDQLTITYKRDIPDLFKYNAFVVISDGVNNKYGSLFSDYEYFYSWRKTSIDDEEVDSINSLYSMIKGMFNKKTLLDIIRNFVYFPDTDDKDLKIVCRYPQYYASLKLLNNIKLNINEIKDGKGGTYFGATGCGKSYTMLYLSRLLMKDQSLKNPTIVLITDRNDLDIQLSQQFVNSTNFIGDKNVLTIKSREDLKDQLKDIPSGGVFLTTVQKFCEGTDILSERSNIICISDEAHRTQINLEGTEKIDDNGIERKYGFAKYLHDSLPNATYVGFTGTPIDGTIKVFGKIVDSYTMNESVIDGITVNIVYDGRAAKVMLNQEKLNEIEKLYTQWEEQGVNEYQIEESKKTVAKIKTIIGHPDRLNKIANDFIEFYEKRVEDKATVAGKALFVCMDRYIAFDLYKKIIELRPDWKEPIKNENNDKVKSLPKINMIMTRDKKDTEELYNLLGDEKYRKEMAKQFKYPDSNFKIAIVVDMWLTGFDVPCLDTMFIDKPIQEHTLIQTISRVNRVYPNKEKGLVVDYFGIKRKMEIALKMFNKKEANIFEDIEKIVVIFKNQIDILNRMFVNFNSDSFFNGTPKERLECLNKATEFVQQTDDFEKRFVSNVKKMRSAYNLCMSSNQIDKNEREYFYFYSAIKSILFKITKGDLPDVEQMNKKVNKLIEEAIISNGVEDIFNDQVRMRAREINIFSTDFIEKLDKLELPNTKIKILENLLKTAIADYKRTNKIKGIEFSEKLQNLIDTYNNRTLDEKEASEVLNNVSEAIINLYKELELDRESFKELGIDFEEKSFYDILKHTSEKYNFNYPEEKIIELSKRIKDIVNDKAKYVDWAKKENIKAEFKVSMILLLAEFGYPPMTNDEVFKEVFEQAENFKKYMK